MGFFCGSAGKESAYNAEDLGSIPGLGRSPAEGKGNALQCSGLGVHGVAKSWTRLSDFHFSLSQELSIHSLQSSQLSCWFFHPFSLMKKVRSGKLSWESIATKELNLVGFTVTSISF